MNSLFKNLRNGYLNLFIPNLFFYLLIGNIILYIISFFFSPIFVISNIYFIVICILILFDAFILFQIKNGITLKRILPEKFSNSDLNNVILDIKNNYFTKVHLEIIDNIPHQFQIRDFHINITLQQNEETQINYELTPFTRGEYSFKNCDVFVKSQLGLISRKFSLAKPKTVKTYPSFLKLKQYDLKSFITSSASLGKKQIRRIGNSYEFEQIKEYTIGDNIKDINWKATAKKNQLMINQYIDEKSQTVYSIIDRGRVMKMPFHNLSLLDYSINATLILSNIILQKEDKAGMFSFSKNIRDLVVADKRNNQMNLILEALYNIDTDYFESDFDKLHSSIKQYIKQRSLLLLYTNFDSLDAVQRQLQYLKAINRSHLLLVIFFKNEEVLDLSNKKVTNTNDIFVKTIAEKFIYEKELIVAELRKNGIQSILTTPSQLTTDTINKYLEIKSFGLI